VLLIDGNNVLFADKPDAMAGLDDAALIGWLSRSSFAQAGVVLVFDGPRRPLSAWDQGVKVVFSGDRSADEVIADRVAASTTPKRLMVVSSDRAVQKQARTRRCTVWGSAEFLHRLVVGASASSGGGQVSGGGGADSAAWLREFGFEQDAQAAAKDAVKEAARRSKTVDDEVDELLRQTQLPPELERPDQA